MQIKQFPRALPKTTDYLLFQSDINTLSCLVSDLPFTPPTATTSSSWNILVDNYTAKVGEKLLVNASNKTLTLPSTLETKDIEIFNISDGVLLIDLNNNKFQGSDYTSGSITLKAGNYTRIFYLNSAFGWLQISGGGLTIPSKYPTGMKLWIEEGSLLDKSGNGNNATSVTGTNPSVAINSDNKTVLRWSGNGNQELQIPAFLNDTIGATLYLVFANSVNSHYNLIRTKGIDDYWRFANTGNGYIGTFLSSRIDNYPPAMPLSGSHLVSIHAKANSYEVLLDNVGKGVQDVAYDAGDRFRIGTNDKPFNGDIALILVYPNWIDKTSVQHQNIISTIKSNYPSLTI